MRRCTPLARRAARDTIPAMSEPDAGGRAPPAPHVAAVPLRDRRPGPRERRVRRLGRSAGIRLWQVLPSRSPGAHDSPYAGLSAFAGNPLLVSPEWLLEEGLLLPPPRSRARPRLTKATSISRALRRFKDRLLRASFAHARSVGESVTGPWSASRPLCRASRGSPTGPSSRRSARAHGDVAWPDWEPALVAPRGRRLSRSAATSRTRSRSTSTRSSSSSASGRGSRRAANARGISILGDLPIYVAHDSADVWSHPRALQLDERRPARRRRGRAARLLQRDRPALGQPALPLGRARPTTLRLVDRARAR